MENWKDITDEEDWAFKARLFILFLMDWEAQVPIAMLEFF